jgi:Flp pilus assembly protein TadG
MADRARHHRQLLARLGLLRRFARADDGAAAIEFAFVAIPFLILVFAIIELGLTFLVSMSLENALMTVDRRIRTGDYKSVTRAKFTTAVCDEMSWLGSSCASAITLDVRVLPAFANADPEEARDRPLLRSRRPQLDHAGARLLQVAADHAAAAGTRSAARRAIARSRSRLCSSTSPIPQPRPDQVHMTRRLSRFWRDRRGVSAVEFALILPLLMLFYFGMAELTEAMMAQRRLSHLTASIGDVVARDQKLTNARRDDVFSAGKVMMSPFPTSTLRMCIVSVASDAKAGQGRVVGKVEQGRPTARPPARWSTSRSPCCRPARA